MSRLVHVDLAHWLPVHYQVLLHLHIDWMDLLGKVALYFYLEQDSNNNRDYLEKMLEIADSFGLPLMDQGDQQNLKILQYETSIN